MKLLNLSTNMSLCFYIAQLDSLDALVLGKSMARIDSARFFCHSIIKNVNCVNNNFVFKV